MEREGYDLREVLQHIDPTALSYQDWVNVGMALKLEGYPSSLWDEWSRRDPGRYHTGECFRKWQSFHGTGTPVTGGTIVQLARDQGWEPEYEEGYAIDWDDVISGDRDDMVVIDRRWLEDREVPEPEKWDPAGELIRYLEVLFEASENVGYVTESWQKTDDKGTRWLPSKGSWDRTAGQLIQELGQCHGDIGAVLGDYKEEAGAWIRFNPLDGNGCKNENVTDYRYALVESDTEAIERQNAIIRELELPVAALVFSGGKSLHAIVRVEAADYAEYRKRVDYLYHACEKNGLKIDTQNRNPSRLSRMPGVIRNGKKQFLVDTNIGKASWAEWYEWIEGINDDLPDPESLEAYWDDLPDLAPPLIDGVLRQGHKMLIAGPSKAGKSFLLIQLCISLAEGRPWLGWPCAQGKVLYVNLELDRASCLHRFRDVYQALHWEPRALKNLDIWNLRGKAVPMDKLAPKLIRRASKRGYMAIVIDPIYKVITGDENSADQMANFCNQFDLICSELGCAVIYCHHHSKGAQGGKRSMDRASGSGVFARDPDAMLDLIELEPTEGLIKQEQNKAACRVCREFLDSRFAWQDDLSQDDLLSSRAMLDYCREKLSAGQMEALEDAIEVSRQNVAARTSWRIDGTLREFPKFPPVNIWFDYPIHRPDESGALGDLLPEDAKPMHQRGSEKNKMNTGKRQNDRKHALEEAIANGNFGDDPKVGDVAEYLGKSERTIRNMVKEHSDYTVENGVIKRIMTEEKD